MRKRLVLVAIGFAAVAMLGIPTASQAGSGTLMQVTGDLVPGGSADITGTGCTYLGTGGVWQVIFYHEIGPNQWEVAGPGGSGFSDTNGQWSFQLSIPANAIPGDTYQIHAGCTVQTDDGPQSFNYDDYDFVMGQPAPTTTSTAAPTTTAGGNQGGSTPTTAVASRAVTADPAFTG